MSLRKREEIQEVLRGIDSGEHKCSAVRPVRVAGIQFSATGSREQNVCRAVEFAETAIQKQADIICFSELLIFLKKTPLFI